MQSHPLTRGVVRRSTPSEPFKWVGDCDTVTGASDLTAPPLGDTITRHLITPSMDLISSSLHLLVSFVLPLHHSLNRC